MTRSNTGGGGGATGSGGGYTLPLAADGVRGGVQLGFTTSAANRNYAVQLDNEKMFVNVPWTDHYAWAEITGKPDSFTPSAHTHAWGDIISGVPATATRWPSWSEVTSKPSSKTAWGQTYLNASSEFQNVSGDLSAGSSGGTISQFHSIELNSAGSLSGYGGFIDFHFNGSSADYTSRIIEDVSGKLNINQAVFVNYNGNVGIGTTSPSYKLHVAGSIYATGAITERSDIRCKDVETYQWAPSLSMIAEAPIIRYSMKDDEAHRMRVGTVAQYWEKVMPEAVSKADDGILSIAQGDICMVCIIAMAREIERLKAKIND